MAIEIPPETYGDRVLKAMGKKRALKFPPAQLPGSGVDVYAVAQRESFIKALLRPKGAKPPEGWTYWIR